MSEKIRIFITLSVANSVEKLSLRVSQEEQRENLLKTYKGLIFS